TALSPWICPMRNGLRWRRIDGLGKNGKKLTSRSMPRSSGGCGSEALPAGHRDCRRFIDRRRGVYEPAREEVARGNRIGIGMPVLAELAYGIENSASRDRNMHRLRAALSALKLWPFDEKAAFEYGRIAAELRRLGRPMQVVDMMVAAIAFSLGNCTVV